MNKSHDPLRHLDYLRQSLAQDTKPIGFFLSAGCPLSVEMPEDQWPLIPDVKHLTQWINNELKSNDKYSSLLKEIDSAQKDRENIEDILSFIRGLKQVSIGGTVRGFTEMDLEKLENLTCNKIVEKVNVKLPDSDTPYHRLSKWISSIDRENPIEIFTTNYDLLLEEAMEGLGIPFFDGFIGSIKSFFDLRAVENNLIPAHWTRLWKIHGSINWYEEENQNSRNVFRSSEIKEGSHLIYPSHLKYEQSKKMPYLALIDRLNNFIRQKSSLLILSGYSFNDEHLNDTIVNALKANPSSMVLALLHNSYLDENEKERYPKAYQLASDRHNLNVWCFDKAIIGTNTGSWEIQKSLEDKDLNNFVEGDNKNIVKLGDFAVFTRFLKMLIGSNKEIEN